MANLITVDEVRTACGIGSDLVSDADVTTIITDVQSQTEKYLGTKLTATQRIEIKDGNGEDNIFLDKTPVLTVRAIKLDDSTVTLSGIAIDRESGKLKLTDDSTISTWTAGDHNLVIKYYYGWLDPDPTTQVTISSAVSSGTSVDITVSDGSGFSVGDWIKITGMDGNSEACKITAVNSNILTVDEVVFPHESGSMIEKLTLPNYLKRLLIVLTSIALVARVVGQTYTDITGYGIGDMNVQKGEPYTQWRETSIELIRERDEIFKRIRPRIVVR